MKPTIKLGAKNPKLAMIGHLLALVGGIIAVVFGILGIGDNILGALLGILTGIFIVAVELDTVKIPFLKDAMIRGIIWIVLALVAGFGLGWLASVLTAVAGILYLVYNFS